MAERIAPQTTTGVNSPISDLISNALVQWGAGNPGSADAATVLMFLTYANQVISIVNRHPYREGMEALPYVKHPSDESPVNDLLMIAGLLHFHAEQQGSERMQIYAPKFYREMNSILWDELAGNSKISLRPMDHKSTTSAVTGQSTE